MPNQGNPRMNTNRRTDLRQARGARAMLIILSVSLVVIGLLLGAASALALELPPVDPDTDTDRTVNQFLLNEVRQGRTNMIAGGGWWGPPERFATNQLWAITESESGIFQQGDRISARVACLRPGGGNGYGTNPNTLLVRNLIYNNTRHVYAQRVLQNGEFVLLESRGFRPIALGKTDPVRTQCFSQERVANIFGQGIPVVGDILRTGVKIPWWHVVDKAVLDNTPAGFNVLGTLVRSGTLLSVPIAAQAWYQQTGYHYSVLDSAIDEEGRLIAAVDLAGTTVRGTLRLHWYAMRGSREESHGTSDFQHEIHHMELRVEEGGEDYTYFTEMAHAGVQPLSDTNYKELYTDLDTRLLSDGWHIISFHSHAIDRVTAGAGRNMQLAAELKVPICVANVTPHHCADGTPPIGPTTTPVVPQPPLATATPDPLMPTATPDPLVPTATPVVPPSANLLINGDFQAGLNKWQWFDSGGSLPVVAGDTVLLPPGSHASTQFYQRGVRLVSQQRYIVKITVQALTADAELGVYLHDHDAPYTLYGLRETFPVDTSWQTVEIPFIAKNFSDSTNNARFRLRPIRGSVRLDAISLIVDQQTLGALVVPLHEHQHPQSPAQPVEPAGVSGPGTALAPVMAANNHSGHAAHVTTAVPTDGISPPSATHEPTATHDEDAAHQLFLPLVNR